MLKMCITIYLLTSFSFGEINSKEIEKQTNLIWDGYTQIDLKDKPKYTYVSTLNKKQEIWKIYSQGKYSLWTIEYATEGSKRKEFYFFINHKASYIRSKIQYMMNGIEDGIFQIEYFIKGSEIISYESLGHGVTEHTNWDPYSVFDAYNKRLAELKILIKKK